MSIRFFLVVAFTFLLTTRTDVCYTLYIVVCVSSCRFYSTPPPTIG